MKEFSCIMAEKALNFSIEFSKDREDLNFWTHEILNSAREIYDFLNGESRYFLEDKPNDYSVWESRFSPKNNI